MVEVWSTLDLDTSNEDRKSLLAAKCAIAMEKYSHEVKTKRTQSLSGRKSLKQNLPYFET